MTHRGPIHSLALPQKQDSRLWGHHPLAKTSHRMKLSLLPVHWQNDPALELIPEPSSKVTDVLLNAKSRNVSWWFSKSLWDWEVAVGRSGDGQRRKKGWVLEGEGRSGLTYFQLWCSSAVGPVSPLWETNIHDLKQTAKTKLVECFAHQ